LIPYLSIEKYDHDISYQIHFFFLYVRTQILLCGSGLELGSQSTCIVSLVFPTMREIIESSGGPCHLFTIPLKNFHLFKIVESVINFYFKKISN